MTVKSYKFTLDAKVLKECERCFRENGHKCLDKQNCIMRAETQRALTIIEGIENDKEAILQNEREELLTLSFEDRAKLDNLLISALQLKTDCPHKKKLDLNKIIVTDWELTEDKRFWVSFEKCSQCGEILNVRIEKVKEDVQNAQ